MQMYAECKNRNVRRGEIYDTKNNKNSCKKLNNKQIRRKEKKKRSDGKKRNLTDYFAPAYNFSSPSSNRACSVAAAVTAEPLSILAISATRASVESLRMRVSVPSGTSSLYTRK